MSLLTILLQRIAMWAVWNVPLGRFAPAVFGFAIGRKGEKR